MKKETVTVDKKLYENLLSNGKQNRKIFDNMLNGLVLHKAIYDEDNNIVDFQYVKVNPSYLSMMKIENPVGRTVKETFKDIEKEWIELYADVVKNKKIIKFEKYRSCVDSWYSVSAFCIDSDLLVCTFSDITNHIKTENLLKEKSHFNDLFLDSLPNPSMLVDHNQIVLASSEKAKEMGAKIGEKCYKNFPVCNLLCKDEKKCYFYQDNELLKEKNIEMEYNGRIWNIWWVPVDTNTILYYLVDITNYIENRKRLEKFSLELQETNKELEQFVYIASHDLQEPLRTISLYCQLIEDLYKEECKKHIRKECHKDLEKYLKDTIDATVRMRDLIKDLLYFSEANRSNGGFTQINVNKLIEEILLDFDAVIKKSRVKINCENLPTILVEKRKISQVFSNLISNCLKFKNSKDLIIEIGCEERENEYEFFVKDNGIGIKEEFYEQIFGIFKKLHAKEEYSGSGIGLAIVKKIIEGYGGKIRIESEFGEGTTFFFTIPKNLDVEK